MSDLRWGSDDLFWGEDRLLWGSTNPVEHNIPRAAIVHTMGVVRYPNGDIWPLWTGPRTAIVESDRASLRRGEATWYYDSRSPVSLSLPGRDPNDRITAAAVDPYNRTHWVVVSSTAGAFWYHNGVTTTRHVPDSSGNRPAWLPEGHKIYPIGGASILHDGTLVIACWAGTRYAEATATNGYRYPQGRWCFYLHRLRDPGMETVPNPDYDPDADPPTPETITQAVVPAVGAPTIVGFSQFTRPFPTGDRRLRYDFTKFHAIIQRYMRYRAADANDIVFLGYSRDVASPRTGGTGVSNEGLHGFILKAEAVTNAATIADDYLPQDPNRTIVVIGAPLWSRRGEYRNVADDGTTSWWIRRDGTIESRVSFARAVPVLQFLFSISLNPTELVSRTSLPTHAIDSYSGLISVSDDLMWLIHRRTGEVVPLKPGWKLLSAASALRSVSPLRSTRGIDDTQRVEISIVLPNETDDGRVLEPVDDATIWIDTVWSDDSGGSWNMLERAFWGTLSNPRLSRGPEGGYIYELTVYSMDSDTPRRRPRHWEDSTQKALYPGPPEDRFFEGQGEIVDGSRLDRWPPKVFV